VDLLINVFTVYILFIELLYKSNITSYHTIGLNLQYIPVMMKH